MAQARRKFSDREKTVIFWCLLYLVGDGIVALLLPAGCRWASLYVWGAAISAAGAAIVILGWVRLPDVAMRKDAHKGGLKPAASR